MDTLLETLIAGLFLGGIYALLAVPLSVVWITTDVVDVSTGAYAVVAGYIAFGLGMPWGGVVGVAAAAGLGLVMGTTFRAFHAIREVHDGILIVLASLALLLMIQSAVLTTAGTDSRFLPRIPGSWRFGDSVVAYQGLFNLVVSVVITVSLALLIKRTSLGLSMRASAISAAAAALAGIRVRSVQMLTFVMCAAIAGVGGVLAVMTVGLTYTSPLVLSVSAFSAAIVFGKRSPQAAFAGALAIGVVTALSETYLSTGWAPAVPSVLILILLGSGRMPVADLVGGRP